MDNSDTSLTHVHVCLERDTSQQNAPIVSRKPGRSRGMDQPTECGDSVEDREKKKMLKSSLRKKII